MLAATIPAHLVTSTAHWNAQTIASDAMLGETGLDKQRRSKVQKGRLTLDMIMLTVTAAGMVHTTLATFHPSRNQATRSSSWNIHHPRGRVGRAAATFPRCAEDVRSQTLP